MIPKLIAKKRLKDSLESLKCFLLFRCPKEIKKKGLKKAGYFGIIKKNINS
jgi:hypothetical protein